MGTVKYLIKVDIHEAKDVIFKEPGTETDIVPNLYINVTLGSIQYSTAQKNLASSAIFNSSFNFSVDLTPSEFQRNRIIISLHHKYTIQSGDIGHHAFGLPFVYSKQQHCIHRSWVKVFCPAFPNHNAGMLLVSIGVFGPGDNVPLFKDNASGPSQPIGGQSSSNYANRYSKSPELGVKYYVLYFNIVCGRDFVPTATLLSQSLAPFVKICHFGMEEQTPIIKDTPNPEWQTTIYMPCITPSSDDLVTLEVWNGESGPTLLHMESIDLRHLLSNEYPPKWVNIYSKPNSTDVLNIVKNYVVGLDNSLTDYAGRILISASSTQVQSALVKGIKPCRSIVAPPIQQRTIWVDIYEIMALSDSPSVIQVIISHGPYSVKTNKLGLNQHGSYKIDDTNGRLPALEPIVSSNDDSDIWDLFVYVYDITSWDMNNSDRIAWKRIPYERIKLSDGKPMWILMTSTKDYRVDSFNILITFDITSNITSQNRKNRLKYSLTKYIFRSMIYEILNLPCLDFNNFPECFVEIELGGYCIRSKSVKGTLHPSFYEAKEIEILLPTNLLLAPDIAINVYSSPTSLFGTKELLCSGHFSLVKVPKEWTKAPQWIKLKSNINAMHKPKILLAFELMLYDEYKENPELYPFFDDILPSTIPSLISILLIGVRAFKTLNKPTVSIRYGMSSNPKQAPSSSKPISGSYGNWNYLTVHELYVDLPKRMHHHCYLEFIVSDEDSGDNNCYGITYLTLNQFLPWLSVEERNTSKELFKLQVLEDFLATGEQTLVDNVKSETIERKGINDDILSMNMKVLDNVDIVSLQRAGEPVTKSDTSTNCEDAEFEISIVDDDDLEDTQRDELPYEMECDFVAEDLPYMKAPIVRCTSEGVPETVGTLKFMCTVNKAKSEKVKDEAFQKMQNHRKKLLGLYSLAKELVVRVYVLQAKGLFSNSGSTGISTYLWVRNVDDEGASAGYYPNSVRDSNNLKLGLKPTFNTCYNIGSTLPETSILKISVISQGAIADEEIGTTFIDCEDRFFNQKMQQIMADDSAPIELRTLKCESSTVSRGTMRCWIEMMDINTAKMKPIKNFGNLEPADYEIRVVIWKAKAEMMDEVSTVSLFVRGIFQTEDEEIVNDTDTHYNSKDGSAVFNWRLKYRVRIPSEYSSLKLQLYSYGILSSNKMIGEAIVDLSADFNRIRRKGAINTIPRFWINCFHAAHGNQPMGSIEIEISFIASCDAQVFNVGSGRDPPNRDPFLPPVLENRTLVDWDGVRETIDNASGAILSGFKITGIFISIAAAFALFIIILIIIK